MNNEEFREIIRRLKEPFEPSAHVERDLPGGGKWLYIPWQKIRERLDEVCPDWQEEYTTPVYLDKYCTIGCTITINGVSRQRWGNAEIELLSRNGRDMSRGTAIERAVADAFKSAAESFGVAQYLDEQSDDRRQFTIRYLHSKGDGRALKAAKENGWIEGNLPTASQKAQMREQESAQRRAPASIISENQVKRLWAIAKKSKFTDEGVHRLIAKWGFESVKDITADKYGDICQYAEDPGQATIFNQEPPAEGEPKPFDRGPIYAEISKNMEHLGWNKKTGAAFLKDNYGGKATRDQLDDGELLDFAEFLNRQVSALQEVAS